MKLLLIIAGAILLAGCGNTTKPLYHWGDYQKTIYHHYQKTETTPQEQITALKKNIEKSQSKGLIVPPGLHAHLGLLYSDMGSVDLAIAEFNMEKELYPESEAYMTYLMKNKERTK